MESRLGGWRLTGIKTALALYCGYVLTFFQFAASPEQMRAPVWLEVIGHPVVVVAGAVVIFGALTVCLLTDAKASSGSFEGKLLLAAMVLAGVVAAKIIAFGPMSVAASSLLPIVILLTRRYQWSNTGIQRFAAVVAAMGGFHLIAGLLQWGIRLGIKIPSYMYVVGIRDYNEYLTRTTGLTWSPLSAATIFTVLIVLALIARSGSVRPLMRHGWLLYAAIATLMLLQTGTRSAIAWTVLTLLATWWTARKAGVRFRSPHRRRAEIILVGAFLGLSVIVATVVSPLGGRLPGADIMGMQEVQVRVYEYVEWADSVTTEPSTFLYGGTEEVSVHGTALTVLYALGLPGAIAYFYIWLIAVGRAIACLMRAGQPSAWPVGGAAFIAVTVLTHSTSIAAGAGPPTGLTAAVLVGAATTYCSRTTLWRERQIAQAADRN